MVRQIQSLMRSTRNPGSSKDGKKTAFRDDTKTSAEDEKDSPIPSSVSSQSQVTHGTEYTGASHSDDESIRSGELGDSEDSGLAKGLKKRPTKKRGSMLPGQGSKERALSKTGGKDRSRKIKRERRRKEGQPANASHARRKTQRRTSSPPKSDVTTTEPSATELQLSQPSDDSSDEFDTDLESRFPSPPMVSLDTTGKMRYLDMCKRYNIAPCSLFLRQAMNSTLNLIYYGMGPRELMALSMVFRDNTYITHLNISYNNIGTDGVVCLARSLKDNQHLTEIDMSFCFLGREEYGAKSVFYLLKCSDNIHSLNLTHNCFRSRDYVWFAELLSLPTRLYYLNLSDNDFGPTGTAIFADALENNTIVNGLNLDLNPLQSAGAIKILQAVAKNTALMALRLTRVGMYDNVCGSILTVLKKNSTLQCLDVRNNNLQANSTQVSNINQYLQNNEMKLEIKMF